ncbi:SHOCT domain-containing protein [Clostridium sp. Mt-5]|uniref:SHOCT domain-containing protein n=1 Tax=Clostridium moutaii TaxID=3240932 RepID=A0ABV4BSD9_9CLOT
MFCNGFGTYYGYGGFNLIIMIPVLIVCLLIAYFIYKAISSRNLNLATNISSAKAMSILNERFAKGEISEEEYKTKKNQMLK